MSINQIQFRELIVRPVLKTLDLWTPAAEDLIIGTAAQESHLEYLKQLGGGPALGLYQIEPETHEDLYKNFFPYVAGARFLERLKHYHVTWPGVNHDQLIWNIAYATAIARLVYYRKPFGMPKEGVPYSLGWLADTWKRYYNTSSGSGTPEEFERSYKRYVEGK